MAGGRNIGSESGKALLAIKRFGGCRRRTGRERGPLPAPPTSLVHLGMIGPSCSTAGEDFRIRHLSDREPPGSEDFIAHLTDSLERTLLLAPAVEPVRS
jgi:hypothetical protein